jgi:hypothetical protein
MGVDVLLYALVHPTRDEFEAANRYFTKHTTIRDEYERDQLKFEGPEYHSPLHDFNPDGVPQWPRVEVQTLDRYYHVAAWPRVYQAICLLQACFPDAVIAFGGDSLDFARPITDERIEERWAEWYLQEYRNERFDL